MNDKMTDAELSKILGRYQAAESIGIFLGALCVIALILYSASASTRFIKAGSDG